MKKLIKNYTTDIPIEKTIAEIQKILAQNGARGIALEYDENGTIKDVFLKLYSTIKNFRSDYQLKWRECIKRYGERNRNGNADGMGMDGDSKLNASHGGSVKHGLRHRSPLSIWNRQKLRRFFSPISLCRAIRHCLKRWNKISSSYQISTIPNENSLRHYV